METIIMNAWKKEENLTENLTTPMVSDTVSTQNKQSMKKTQGVDRLHPDGCNFLKSEKYQDYSQKPQRNCTFMNSISVHYASTCSTSGRMFNVHGTA